MLRKLLIAAALIATVGCDDPTVHSLITSNFVCVYMPYWMGECDSTAFSDRAQNVLDHGLVQAEVECSGTTPSSNTYKFKADLLQDGASIVSYACSACTGLSTSFNSRGNLVKACQLNGAQFCFEAAAGQLAITSPGFGGVYDKTVDLDSEECTGFNLSAFGVTEE